MLRLNPYAQIDSQETAGSDANEATEEKNREAEQDKKRSWLLIMTIE